MVVTTHHNKQTGRGACTPSAPGARIHPRSLKWTADVRMWQSITACNPTGPATYPAARPLQLAPDLNPEWPAEWQRHFAAVWEMLEVGERARLPRARGDGARDGRRPVAGTAAQARRRAVGHGRAAHETGAARCRTVLPPEQEPPPKPSMGGPGAFERGVADPGAVKGPVPLAVPRVHVERLEDGAEVRLRVFASNAKTPVLS